MLVPFIAFVFYENLKIEWKWKSWWKTPHKKATYLVCSAGPKPFLPRWCEMIFLSFPYTSWTKDLRGFCGHSFWRHLLATLLRSGWLMIPCLMRVSSLASSPHFQCKDGVDQDGIIQIFVTWCYAWEGGDTMTDGGGLCVCMIVFPVWQWWQEMDWLFKTHFLCLS